jgi:hypothetical protein
MLMARLNSVMRDVTGSSNPIDLHAPFHIAVPRCGGASETLMIQGGVIIGSI